MVFAVGDITQAPCEESHNVRMRTMVPKAVIIRKGNQSRPDPFCGWRMGRFIISQGGIRSNKARKKSVHGRFTANTIVVKWKPQPACRATGSMFQTHTGASVWRTGSPCPGCSVFFSKLPPGAAFQCRLQ